MDHAPPQQHEEPLPDDGWRIPARDVFGSTIELAPGLIAPEFATGRRRWEAFKLALTVRAVPGRHGRAGRFVCYELDLQQLDDGPAVTSEALRRLPVAAMVRELAAALWTQTGNPDRDAARWAEESPEAVGRWRLRLGTEEYERIRDQGPTAEALAWVAHAYRLALVLGDPPTQAVERLLGLPRSTAGRWVTLARAQGHLGAAEGAGRAGG